MDIELWAKFLAGIATLLGVGVTVFLAARKATNRESIAHRRASEALSLLKSWGETKLGEDDHGDVRAKETLRRELLSQAFRSTQIYVSSTKPILTTYWQPVIFFVASLFCLWAFTQTTGASEPGSSGRIAMVTVVLVVVIFLVIVMSLRVSQHHEDQGALNSSRKRRAISREKANQRTREERNTGLVAVGAEHEQDGDGD